jgi:hypothetical protein
MRKILATFVVTTLLLSAAAAVAEEAPKQDAPVAQTAVFAVPNLSDGAVVKGLTQALAKQEGVVAAKAETEAGKFLITFESGKTCPGTLTAVVTKVAPEAKLEGVHEADAKAAAHGDCGKCPSKATCQKAKKTSS